MSVTLHFSRENYELLSDYIYWKCLFRERCSRSSFTAKLILYATRKDKDFREFRKNLHASEKNPENQ